ncbi:hypothetical protein JCM1841_003922 [Sporobolomyces salmonicolor]
MSSIETYIATDSSIAYYCPPELAENNAWKTRNMSDTVGDSAAKVTTGAGCTARFKFTDPDGTSLGCSIDGGTTWTYFTTGKAADGNWGEGILMASPPPSGPLHSKSLATSGHPSRKLTTSMQVTYLTVAAAQTADWTSTTSTSSTSSESPTSSSTGTTASSGTDASSSESKSFSLGTTIASSSAFDSTSNVAGSTGIFITVAVALLGIVVACAIAAICLRTKPKYGREETGLLARRQRVKQLEEAEAAG